MIRNRKQITAIDQINMLIKHANRHCITISSFDLRRSDNVVFANIDGGSYFTIFVFIDDCDLKFNLQ